MISVIDVFAGLRIGSDERSRLSRSVPYSTMYSSWYRNDGILQDTVADVSSTSEDARSSVAQELKPFYTNTFDFRALTWNWKLRVGIAESVDHICEVGVCDVEASNVGGGWVVIGIGVTCSTETNSCTFIPFHQTTLVDEDGVGVSPVSYQNRLECIFLEKNV